LAEHIKIGERNPKVNNGKEGNGSGVIPGCDHGHEKDAKIEGRVGGTHGSVELRVGNKGGGVEVLLKDANDDNGKRGEERIVEGKRPRLVQRGARKSAKELEKELSQVE